MRVQRGQHAVQGRLDQLLVVGLDDVLLLHDGEHVAEQFELSEGLCLGREGGRAREGHDPRAQGQGGSEA